MGTSRNWLAAKERVGRRMIDDCLAEVKKWIERGQPIDAPPVFDFKRLQRETLEQALAEPRVKEIYWQIRTAIWEWEEFAGLRPGARAILEVVVELARAEAFPWYVCVPAHEVRRLARLNEASFARSARELEMFAITRRAEVIHLVDSRFEVHWPGWTESEADAVDCERPDFNRGWFRLNNRESIQRLIASWKRNLSRGREEDGPHPRPVPQEDAEDDPPSRPVSEDAGAASERAQWVVRYRRGIPWNRKRTAWWINYDLFSGTGRVLPGFVVDLRTLPRTYSGRNRTMGGPEGGLFDRDGFAAFERQYARKGPPSRPGLRVALWEGFDEGSEARMRDQDVSISP